MSRAVTQRHEKATFRRRRARVRSVGAVRQSRSNPTRPKIAVLVPAHNEERLIGKTIDSLLAQSLQPDRILVIADNCTDRTVEIARAKGVEVMETVGNTAKKAGALNQGFRRVHQADVIVQVDADIVFDRDFVREIVAALRADKQLGAVSARVGVQPFPGGGPVSWMLWALQRLEYYYYDSMKIENRGKVWCISGIGGAYRGSVLRAVAAGRRGPWNEDSIVEDYSLSLDIEDRGWRTGSALCSFAWSDTMPTLGELWRQRFRWNAGTLLEWKSRPATEATETDRRTFRRGLFLLALNPMFLALLIFTIWSGAFRPGPTMLVTAGFFSIDRLYRLRYVPRRTLADVLIAVLVVPEMLYRLLIDANLYWAAVKTRRSNVTARRMAW